MLKDVMGGPGELDPLVRELIYIAVSVTNGCDYCIASHRAAAVSKGMTDAASEGALALLCLGDLVGYGADPRLQIWLYPQD